MTTHRIDLRRFVSVHAHPGESAVFSPFSTNMDIDDATNLLTQAQRRKNARILMEACLFANGGTGAYNGRGWYSSAGTSTTNNFGAGGTVYIGGNLPIEPYIDSQYFPNFAAGYWTLPGGINLLGNGVSPGDAGTDWYAFSAECSRIVCYGSYVGWHPRGGPTPSGSTARHLDGWFIDNIGITRRGNTAGEVFVADHWYESDSAIHLNQNWHIGKLIVEMEPGSGTAEQTGVRIGCGLHCQVDKLDVLGHYNPGWGLVVHGLFKPDGSFYTYTTSTEFGMVRSLSAGKGVAVSHANFFCRLLNIEGNDAGGSRQRLVFGDLVPNVKVDTLWMENVRNQASGYQGAVVIGLTPAEMVALNALPSFVTAATSAFQGTYEFPNVPFIGKADNATNQPEWAFLLKLGHLRLGHVYPGFIGGLWKIEHRTTTTYEGACRVTWDENLIVPNGTNYLVTSHGLLNADAAVAAKIYRQFDQNLAVDRHRGRVWETTASISNTLGKSMFGRRFYNSLSAQSFNLPDVTATDVGKRVSFMKVVESGGTFQVVPTGNDRFGEGYANTAVFITVPFIEVVFEVAPVEAAAGEAIWACVQGFEACTFRGRYDAGVPANNFAAWGQLNFPSYGASPYSLGVRHGGRPLTNVGASALMTFNLPDGANSIYIGTVYEFWRVESFEVRIVPTVSAKIGDGAVNKYLSMLSDGSVIKIRMVRLNFWIIENSSGVYEFQT